MYLIIAGYARWWHQCTPFKEVGGGKVPLLITDKARAQEGPFTAFHKGCFWHRRWRCEGRVG